VTCAASRPRAAAGHPRLLPDRAFPP
jgi:hypothetical protein